MQQVWLRDLVEQARMCTYDIQDGRDAPDVRATLAAIYRAKTGASAEDAEAWLNNLATQGRYLADV